MIGILLGGLGWLKSALSAAFRWCLAHPWQFAAIALAGMSLWLYMGKQSETRRADAWHHAWQAQKNASEAAARAQKALNAKVQSTYQEQADGAQERHDTRSPRVRDAVDTFVDARRVQAGQCGPGQGHPASGGGDPAVPAPVPGDSLVLVDEPDVRACADATAYAVSAYEFASGLIKAGVAR